MLLKNITTLMAMAALMHVSGSPIRKNILNSVIGISSFSFPKNKLTNTVYENSHYKLNLGSKNGQRFLTDILPILSVPPKEIKHITSGVASNYNCMTVESSIANELPYGANFNNPYDLGIAGDSSHYGTYYFKNNLASNYQNDFGNISDDIIMKITLAKTSIISINTCYSDFDSFIYFLDENHNIITFSDDQGPFCPTTNRASLQIGLYKNQTVVKGRHPNMAAPGTYYIVLEGYGAASGAIMAGITVTSQDNLNKWYHRDAALEENNLNLISVAPNPANSTLHITTPGMNSTRFILYDNFGKVVKQENLKSEEN